VRLEEVGDENYNGFMKGRTILGVFLLLVVPGLSWGQSLTEVAEKEKERRRKNKESGEQVQVITDRELASNQGRIANPSATDESAASGESAEAATAAGSSEPRDPDSVPMINERETNEEPQPVTEIPADADLEQKLNLLERMKADYQRQVSEIDAEIQENNQRIEEIQTELVSTGGTGLPTAPQADRGVRNPGNIPALRNEQQELRDRNQALEAQKQSIKENIITRARRAGIPASYLNF